MQLVSNTAIVLSIELGALLTTEYYLFLYLDNFYVLEFFKDKHLGH